MIAIIKREEIPGWLFFEGDTLRARIHGNSFWNIKGKLGQKFPRDDFLFDPLTFGLNNPTDFAGPFNGTVGEGFISLLWKQSGASIRGRSPIGDFVISGESTVDFGP